VIRVENSVVIDCPVSDVFAFVTDATNDPQWHTDAFHAMKTSEGPIRVGTTFTVGISFLGKRDAYWRVVELEPNRREVIDVTAPPFNPTLTYVFEPANGATRFTRRIEVEPRGYVKVLAPLVRRMMQRRNASFMPRLKAALEQSSFK
jgi:hypothetical protein